jgi:hypothetical protein
MLFALWYNMPHRTTIDMDLLAFGDNDLLIMKKKYQSYLVDGECVLL